jgi:hypothetical protein
MKSADRETRNKKGSKTTGFTIIESVFVIIAIVVISFILTGLYVRNTKPALPSSPENGTTATLPSEEAAPLDENAP